MELAQHFNDESVERYRGLDVNGYSQLAGRVSDLKLPPNKVAEAVTKARVLVGHAYTQRRHLQHIAKTAAANGHTAAFHAGQLAATMSRAAASAGRSSAAVNILGAAAGAASFCKQFSTDSFRVIAPPDYNVGRIGVQDREEELAMADAVHVLYPVLEARERQLLLAEAKVAAAASKDAKKAAEQAFRRHQQKALAVMDRLHAFLNEESVQGVMDVVDGTTELDTAIATIAASLQAYQQLLCTPLQPAADGKEGAAGGAQQPSQLPAKGAGDGTVHVSRRPVPQPESKAA